MKKRLILGLLFIWCFQAYSQSNDYNVIPSSGNYFTSTDFSLSWTLGECITETFQTTENILTQGFQQSLFLITSLNEFTVGDFSVKVYPNPFTDLINIFATYNTVPDKSIRIELFDAQGKKLFVNKFNSDDNIGEIGPYSIDGNTLSIRITDIDFDPPTATFLFTKI